MKILVTGGAGFIASQIADAYIEQGHEVTIVDDLTSGNKKNVNPKAQFVTMDVRDPNISTLFAKTGFDVVNHHAAQIDVRRSVQDPFLDASINVLGTLRLLECCRTYGTRKFIFASSGGAIRLSYTILRYANVYGPRQDSQGEAGVVSIFAGKLLANEAVTIFGTGRQERDYVYVGDIVAANVAALTKGENQTFNIGTQIASSVNALYEKLAAVHASAPKPQYAPAREGELERSVLNASLAQQQLGWRPSRTLEQGLEETYRYFQQQKPPLAAAKKA